MFPLQTRSSTVEFVYATHWHDALDAREPH
jgi:hypothetical protein